MEKWKHLASEAQAIKIHQSVQDHRDDPFSLQIYFWLYTHSVASLNSTIIYDTDAFTQFSVSLYIMHTIYGLSWKPISIMSRSYYCPKSLEINEKLYFLLGKNKYISWQKK